MSWLGNVVWDRGSNTAFGVFGRWLAATTAATVMAGTIGFTVAGLMGLLLVGGLALGFVQGRILMAVLSLPAQRVWVWTAVTALWSVLTFAYPFPWVLFSSTRQPLASFLALLGRQVGLVVSQEALVPLAEAALYGLLLGAAQALTLGGRPRVLAWLWPVASALAASAGLGSAFRFGAAFHGASPALVAVLWVIMPAGGLLIYAGVTGVLLAWVVAVQNANATTTTTDEAVG